MSCPFCASDNPSKAQFCLACGAELPRLSASDASADALPIGTLLAGTYAVESVLGQGGFGITYCCHDQMLDRPVAVKEFFPSGCRREDAAVQPSRGLSDANFGEARAQFLAEARLLARCHHAGIVGVHTAFEANSTAYMVMELLHGSHLAQLLEARGGRLTQAEAVPLIERAGEALQWVHDKGLLHRDIKPENIIVCDDGRVMLIDFGTAREYAQGQAQGHTIVVTPGYAPLEQYAKQAKRGAFTDVYGLAATSYHLLTGQAPPAASDRAVGVQLRPVREQNPQISQSVARAIEAGLEMEIAKRPQSVREFLELMHAPTTQAVEIAAFEVASTPRMANENAMAEAQRDTLLALSAAPPHFFSDALQSRQEMLDAAVLVPPVQPVQLAPLVTPPPILPILPTTTTAVTKPTALFSNLDPNSPSNLPSNGGGYLTQPAGHFDDPIKSVFWWVGGMALFVGFLFFAGSSTRSNRSTGYSSSGGYYSSPNIVRFPPNYSSSYQPTSPAYSTSTTSASNTAREAARREIASAPAILPASTETLPISAPVTGRTNSAQSAAKNPYLSLHGLAEFSPDGRLVAYLDKKAVVRVWSLSKRRVVSSLSPAKNHPPVAIRFSPDAKNLVLTCRDKDARRPNDQVTVWNFASGKSVGTLAVDPQKESLTAQAVLPDGKVLIAKSPANNFDARYFLWNPRTGKQSTAPMKEKLDGVAVTVAAYGEQIVTGDRMGRIQWRNARTGSQKADFSTSETFQEFRHSPLYPSNLSGGTDSSAPLPVTALQFSRNGSFLASRNPMKIRVFDSNATEVGALPTGDASTFAVSPDGQFVVEGGGSQTPDRNLLWNVRSGQKIRVQGVPGQIRAWDFSPDGKRIIGLSSSENGISLSYWAVNAQPIAPFSALQSTPLSLYNSISWPSAITLSNRLGVSQRGLSLEARRLDGSLFHAFDVGRSAIIETAFSPDGQFLSSRAHKGVTRIWNVETRQLLGRLEALAPASEPVFSKDLQTANFGTEAIKSLLFSSDNSLLARTGSAEGKNLIEVWSLKGTPRRIASFPLSQPPTAFTFSLDNRALLCGDATGRLRAYDLSTQKLLAETRNGPTVISHLVPAQQGLAVVSVGRVDVATLIVTLYEVPSRGVTAGLMSGQKRSGFFKRKSQATIDPVRYAQGSVAVSPDGRFVATAVFFNPAETGQADGLMKSGVTIWNLPSGSEMQKLPVQMSSDGAAPSTSSSLLRLHSLSFSPDGTQLNCVARESLRGRQEMMSWQVPSSEETSG